MSINTINSISEPTLLLAHFAACVFMTGLIWVIQLVHYPSFKFTDKIQFADSHAFHTKMITFIVGPVMLFEITTGLLLLFQTIFFFEYLLNFALLILIWLATAFLSVPFHNRLAEKFDSLTVQRLIKSNWLRTCFWSARSALLFYLLLQLMRKET